MSDMFDYLNWRGDIRFSQMALNPVDALIFSTLSYIRFHDVVSTQTDCELSLREAADQLLAMEDAATRPRTPKDLPLLRAAADTERFGSTRLCFYRDVFIPEEETQFAAMTFRMDDGTAFLAFRGTDNTLVGWKEDFNMSFQESIPAQQLALKYLQEFAARTRGPIWMGGHSKGGNLAVYAAAKSDRFTQSRIIAVHNQDGPGFSDAMMKDPGYQRIIPKIRSFVPQSSVIGMLLEHEEPYTIIRSNQIGVMQHDPYSWEVKGPGFQLVEELTEDSRFLDRTFKNWLAGMSNEERSDFFDTVFSLLATGDVSHVGEILHPENVRTYFKTLQSDGKMRHIISTELQNLIESAKQAHQEQH